MTGADDDRVLGWIERGKQDGKRWGMPAGDDELWCSVAIQKFAGSYHVHIDEFYASRAVVDELEREERKAFASISDAVEYLESATSAVLGDLRPLKGSKVFRPSLTTKTE